MKLAMAFAPYPHPVEHWLTVTDGHSATAAYQARYYDVHWMVGGFEGTIQRNDFTIHGCGMDVNKIAETIRALNPDALTCYGPVDHPAWPIYRAAAPNAFFALDYAGGPLATYDNQCIPMAQLFDHIFTAHETQAKVLQGFGLKASKARGVPLEIYKPMPGVPKQWFVLYPANFAPGKRNPLVAQVLEQVAPSKPSLFLGVMEHPTVVEMVRCGGIPLNKTGIAQRNNIQLGGRAPYACMPMLYNASEIVVCGSEEEAGPFVCMEALACGTPVILMSDCAWGVAEEFAEIAQRFAPAVQVVDPWPQGIYQAIERAIRQPPVAELARECAVEHFDFWTMYERIDQTLKNGVGFRQAGQVAA